MTNAMIICIYVPFFIINLLILIEESIKCIERHKINIFLFLYLIVIFWFASDIGWILSPNENIAKFFKSLAIVFIGFIPPILLLTVFDFFHISLKRVARYIPLLFLLPSVTAIMGLTAKSHSLFIAQFVIFSISPVREFTLIWGPWFWVHTAYCYIIMLTIIGVILAQRYRLPRFYRLPSTLMMIGMVFALFGNVVKLLQLLPVAFDPTLICTGISFIFLYFAIINNNESKFIRFSYGRIFDYLDLYLLVMDERERVVHVNRPAHDWLSSLGIAVNSSNISKIMESLLSKGATQKDSENEKGIDIYFPSNPFPLVLNMQTQTMSDTNGDIIGSVTIFADVTQNRLLINMLEKKTGIDSLTGLANHMAYEGAKKRLDTPEYLPLSIIMCDVNGLKTVNDNFGHQYGDMMLQVVSEVLEAACSKPGFVARTGGDEFIYLLPRTSQEDTDALIKKIREMLSNRKNLSFPLSVAFGAATKQFADENLSELIDLADSRMYEDKRLVKLKPKLN